MFIDGSRSFRKGIAVKAMEIPVKTSPQNRKTKLWMQAAHHSKDRTFSAAFRYGCFSEEKVVLKIVSKIKAVQVVFFSKEFILIVDLSVSLEILSELCVEAV